MSPKPKAHLHESKDHKKLSDVLDDLKSRGLKLTRPRKAILTALFEDHGPFTAEQIHGKTAKGVCDLATVYRSLTSLEQVGMLRRVEFGDDSSRYELVESEDQHHHHLICKKCKKIEIIDDHELEEIDRFATRRGYSEVRHSLEFFGICPDCL